MGHSGLDTPIPSPTTPISSQTLSKPTESSIPEEERGRRGVLKAEPLAFDLALQLAEDSDGFLAGPDVDAVLAQPPGGIPVL